MKLVRLPPQLLFDITELPFDVFNAQGQLLLPAGTPIDYAARLQLLRWAVYAEETNSLPWRQQIEQLAEERKERARRASEDYLLSSRRRSLSQEWTMAAMALEAALREPRDDGRWIREARELRARARHLMDISLDASVCHLIHTGGLHTNLYSCHQSLRCMVVAGECARVLGWDSGRIESLELSALTMNVSICRMQDMLALRDTGISAGLRAQLAQHPRDAARLLAAAGVTDGVWLGAVMLHHDSQFDAQPLAGLSTAQQAARLLRRVDIFCAKLSRRGHRAPMPGLRAVREACVGPDGKPDEIGTALLRTVGMYPPGSFVRLASGECALVLARGSRAHAPRVAAFADASGAALAQPKLRDTTQASLAVKASLSPADVHERPNHEKLLALLPR
ncbi:hypothetical protein [uncultured Azohydromonas sp.]|uniref:hypothetical protein n=1 Tax=uncultured Azohydromonas sp. TaxID=487342 RepID=UPI00262BB86A|nr:hypothetical protein [uncultured Azohydromonas sp.]